MMVLLIGLVVVVYSSILLSILMKLNSPTSLKIMKVIKFQRTISLQQKRQKYEESYSTR